MDTVRELLESRGVSLEAFGGMRLAPGPQEIAPGVKVMLAATLSVSEPGSDISTLGMDVTVEDWRSV